MINCRVVHICKVEPRQTSKFSVNLEIRTRLNGSRSKNFLQDRIHSSLISMAIFKLNIYFFKLIQKGNYKPGVLFEQTGILQLMQKSRQPMDENQSVRGRITREL